MSEESEVAELKEVAEFIKWFGPGIFEELMKKEKAKAILEVSQLRCDPISRQCFAYFPLYKTKDFSTPEFILTHLENMKERIHPKSFKINLIGTKDAVIVSDVIRAVHHFGSFMTKEIHYAELFFGSENYWSNLFKTAKDKILFFSACVAVILLFMAVVPGTIIRIKYGYGFRIFPPSWSSTDENTQTPAPSTPHPVENTQTPAPSTRHSSAGVSYLIECENNQRPGPSTSSQKHQRNKRKLKNS
jgi:hypothetical protein